MKYFVVTAFAFALLAGTPAMAAHHGHHGWWDHHDHWAHGMRLHRGWRDYSWFDWRARHLHDPGRNHWIFVDGQYLLVDDRGIVIEVGIP